MAHDTVRPIATVVIAALAVAIGLHIRFTGDDRFRTTPTDFLIVFGVLTLLVLGLINTSSRATVDLVMYSTVLLYGSEILIGQAMRRRVLLAAATLATLLVLEVRGL